MNRDILNQWQRIQFNHVPIYVNPERPDWFVPNTPGDQLLQQFARGRPMEETDYQRYPFLNRIQANGNETYNGRAAILKLNLLKECWLHLTNICNMNCNHCMFASSPSSQEKLTPAETLQVIDEALELGCWIFYFTGGEPFVSAAFFPALQRIFKKPGTHVVILTNLTLIAQHQDKLSAFPVDRLHFQVSIDGIGENHDRLRGQGAFKQLNNNLEILNKTGFPATMAMTVTKHNVSNMEELPGFASQWGISNIHFLWLFKKGLADDSLFVPPPDIFPHLIAAQEAAEKKGIKIDNIEIIRSQIFSCPGTKYDLSNAGWQSIAVGPDGRIYPTPALVYNREMVCGHIKDGLETVWNNSPVLQEIRNASLIQDERYNRNEFKFLIGGGDIDHSMIASGKIVGGDPYLDLYNDTAKWLITREARQYSSNSYPGFRLKMGEILGECPVDADSDSVFYTHSNCVLSLPGHDTHSLVNAFYTEVARNPNQDILNPICYPEELISHIPESLRFRSYGCGSPVVQANLKPGETVVDLGSGTGIECFIASRLAGPDAMVFGIDMGDEMLRIANQSKEIIQKKLDYENIEFKKAFLEDLPLTDNSVDAIISNCVINLSPNKRKVFNEIMRVLKPGGRLVISDITYDNEIPLDIKYNEKLRGECISGALPYSDLFGLLDDLGFAQSKIISGYPYRTVKGFEFYSITYEAYKPDEKIKPEPVSRLSLKEILAQVETTPTCTCFVKPGKSVPVTREKAKRHAAGCMVCGEDIRYFSVEKERVCFYCENVKKANAVCPNEHFVCDQCHSSNAVDIIRQVCLNTNETDMIALMKKIRSHPSFPIHGPEHHSLVPAVILAAYRNSGGELSRDQLLAGIDRGSAVPGGSCAFMGICGAAIGVGSAFSVILEATPYQGKNRQIVQKITMEVLGKIAQFEAPRCCQRDCWLALKQAAHISLQVFDTELKAAAPSGCKQFNKNKECIRHQCPLWPTNSTHS